MARTTDVVHEVGDMDGNVGHEQRLFGETACHMSVHVRNGIARDPVTDLESGGVDTGSQAKDLSCDVAGRHERRFAISPFLNRRFQPVPSRMHGS